MLSHPIECSSRGELLLERGLIEEEGKQELCCEVLCCDLLGMFVEIMLLLFLEVQLLVALLALIILRRGLLKPEGLLIVVEAAFGLESCLDSNLLLCLLEVLCVNPLEDVPRNPASILESLVVESSSCFFESSLMPDM